MEIVKICKKHGHLTDDQVKHEKNGLGYPSVRCTKCKLEKDLRYREKNRKKLCEDNKQYKKNNRNIVNAWTKKDRELNPEKHREWSRIGRERLGELRSIKEVTRLRGITLEAYYEMVGSQDNKCYICGNSETRNNKNGVTARLCVDHNHKTEMVRKLLCHACNQVIGHSRESIDILKKAILYLEEHNI